jgi:hypothetical protein
MPSLVKSIAIVAGTGIALGLYTMSAGTPRRKPEDSDGTDPLFIEPLLDRIEHLEGRFANVGAKGGEAAQGQSLRESIAAQEVELRALRIKVDETERRAAAAVESAETRLRQFRQEIPSLVEAQVEVRVAERIGALERAMADQSTSVGRLREGAAESDANLQRLIAVVERLCERPLQPSSTVLPFEAQLAEAVHRDVPGEPRVRVIKDNEPERRHRFPLGRTFAFFLAFLLPRFHR